MKILETLIFGAALFGSIYFVIRFVIWTLWKVNKSKFLKDLTATDVRGYNIVGFISLFLWMILYYLNI